MTDGTLRLKLKEMREAKFLTQRELAAKAGVGQATIARLEKGRHEPTPQTIERLAAALGVSQSQLVTREPAEETAQRHRYAQGGSPHQRG